MYEMAYGTTPFKASTREQTFNNISSAPVVFPTDVPMSEDFKDCVKKLLERESVNRLGNAAGAEEIKAHPFFKSINWGLLRWEVPPYVPKSKQAPAMCDDEMFEMDM